MIVRQTKDTFIRHYGKIGYITNQLTKHDRHYNETGADFLEKINRIPKDTDLIIGELLPLYQDISFQELKEDFIGFIGDLERAGFLVTGNTIEELNSKEPSFNYNMANPKTETYDFSVKDFDNVQYESSEFFYKEFHKSPQIFGLQIEVTSRCNERCIHCYIPNTKKDQGKDIDLELILRIFDEAQSLRTLQLTLSGGELLLHNDIATILRHARSNDFSIIILSNLVLLTDQHITLLKEINPSIIQCSLYSMKEKEHDAITLVKGSQRKTKTNIERLVEADIPVQISCPVMRLNYNSYKDVISYAKTLRIKAQTDYIMMAQSDLDHSNLAKRLDLIETEKVITDILHFDDDYLNFTLRQKPKSFDIERYKKMPICGVGVDNLCLAANGDYYPCPGWQGLILGNAYKQTMKELWENSEPIKKLRGVTNGSFPNCIICEARDFCSMCLVRNFNESNGDMFKTPKHFCEVAFLNKKIVEDFNSK